ncbi:chemotaxis protein CheX [Desulforamulus putei]|uniref:Chemotaxis protein CheX n=1 Tax=Desulforamulus putei DSM 12395 TaxID=1121429 RepID=A0A1M4VKR9_9FIRM|nr:chemotaxis protein CheX [Desulforamulus putei]SHE69495.1 chemotaxis protein CheX [Desulforamulus putei DSM 12395]
MQLKADYVNAFYLATQEVFKQMLDVETELGQPRAVEDMLAGKEANVLIGLTGDIAGSVLYSYPQKMALEMVKILSGMEMEELDVFVTSALGEMANIISGNAASFLEKAGLKCNIFPPQIILGEHKTVSVAAQKAIVLPLKTNIGEFEVSVAVKNQTK